MATILQNDNVFMEKSEILETLIEHYCSGSKAKFAQMIGITPQLLSNWIKRNTLDYEQVYKGCPNLSGDWLLSGVGSIERQDTQVVNNELLTLCKELVANYQQRDNVINKLMSMVSNSNKKIAD